VQNSRNPWGARVGAPSGISSAWTLPEEAAAGWAIVSVDPQIIKHNISTVVGLRIGSTPLNKAMLAEKVIKIANIYG